MGESDSRARVWRFLVWPESAPDDWRQRLTDCLVPAAISPLHDRDVFTSADERKNPEHVAGAKKKPHYHVTLYFSGRKSLKQVRALLAPVFDGVEPYVEPVDGDVRTWNRYLCHLDQPLKAQYDTHEIQKLNGARCDISMPNPTAAEQHEMLRKVNDFILDHCISEYADVVAWSKTVGDDMEWFVSHNTTHVNGLCRSNRHRTQGNGDETR